MITQAMPAVWQRGEKTGLVHTACATDPDAVPVDLSRACGPMVSDRPARQ